MKKYLGISFLIITGLFTISSVIVSCKNKTDEPAPVVETPTDTNQAYNGPAGTLSLHLHTFIDETEVDGYTYVYTTTEGRKISLNLAQMYLYKITLIKEDGGTFTIKDTIKLKTLELDTYIIGNAPVGNYKSIKFNVGLSSETNALNPSANKLLNRSEMWFGSTAQPDGYVFARIEGKIDTTTAMDAADSEMQPFKYLIGTNANLTTVVMPTQNFSITKDANTFVHLYADYSQIFYGLQINNSNNLIMNTVSDNSTELGVKLRNNIARMFKYEN